MSTALQEFVKDDIALIKPSVKSTEIRKVLLILCIISFRGIL